MFRKQKKIIKQNTKTLRLSLNIIKKRKNMKFLKIALPYLYVLMVLFVVFHNTGYRIERMIQVPYVLYLVLVSVSFFVIRSVIQQSATTDRP